MTLRVGRLPYLHAEPFYFDMERRGILLYDMAPNTVVSAALEGEIDAGLFSLLDCARLREDFEPVAGFCVATMRQAGSVLLYTTQPIEALADARIGVLDETATEVWLLRVLLQIKYQVQPAAYVPIQPLPDALLLTGNDALRLRSGVRGFAHTYDLGAEWFAWTALPFVFARWMVRKDVPAASQALLKDTLYVGLEDGVDRLYRLPDPREDILMLQRDVMKYMRNFRYYIGLSEQKAMDQFLEYVHQIGGPS